jgi:hypothetical protein
MVKSIANDLTMDCMYAESLKLVNFLVMEVMKEGHAAYVSAKGLMMQEMVQKNSG